MPETNWKVESPQHLGCCNVWAIGDYYRDIKGDTRSLDYGSHRVQDLLDQKINDGLT